LDPQNPEFGPVAASIARSRAFSADFAALSGETVTILNLQFFYSWAILFHQKFMTFFTVFFS
jgi:hypothetical protein